MFTRRSIAFILIFVALAAAVSGERAGGQGQAPSEEVVKFVSDGDTIVLESGDRVRYLGIDAPEIGHGGEPSDCYGQKAKKANMEMVLGKKITLRRGHDTRDHYGRRLAWVFTPGGTCVNLELVRSGNAWVYRTHENADPEMLGELLKAQREAIRERRGLWGACSVKPAPSYFGNLNTYVFHRPDCPYGREMSVRNKMRFSGRLEAFFEGFSPCRACRP